MQRLFLAVVVVVAVPAHAERPATCEEAARTLGTGTFDELRKLAVRQCKLARWSAGVRACFASLPVDDGAPDQAQMTKCFADLTGLQRARWELALHDEVLHSGVIEVTEAGDDKLEATRKAGTLAIQPDAASLAAIRDVPEQSRLMMVAVHKVCVATTGRVSEVKTIKPSRAAAYDQRVIATIKKTWKFAPRERQTCKPYHFRSAVK